MTRVLLENFQATTRCNQMKLKKFVSPTDGCKFDYFISGGILSYRMVESQFWHDYNPNNKDYSDYEHKEFQMLLNS